MSKVLRTTAASLSVLLGSLAVGIGETPGSAMHRDTSTPSTEVAGSSAFDWPEFHLDPGLTGYAQNSPLSTSVAPGLGVARATNLYGAALDSPVVAYDASLGKTLAYVGNEAGDVEAVDIATGKIRWGEWLGSPIRTTPVVSGGAVYVGTFNSPHLYKLDASTGAVDCSVAAPQPIEGTPLVVTPPGGTPTVYIGTNDSSTASGPLMAVDAGNCALKWAFTGYGVRSGTWTAAAYGLDASGEPLVVFGSADPDSAVYALDAVTGTEVWRFAIDNPPPGSFDVGAGVEISPPGVNGFTGGVAYVPSKYGIMYALDLTTGAEIWSTNFDQIANTTEGSRSTAALDGTNLVFGYGHGLLDLNALDGSVKWLYKDPSSTESISSPAIAGASPNEVVAVGDLGGGFDVVSLATGTQLYRYQTGGYITASPAVTDGNVLICSSDGFLYDFAVGGGNDASLPTTTITSPTGSGGTLPTLPNPNGDLTISGSATDPSGVNAVVVAVQENGSGGEWWDAATNTWSSGPVGDSAALANRGATSSSWTFSYPVPRAGGTYSVTAYSASTSGQSDTSGAQVSFAVTASKRGPHINVSPAYVSPGATVTVTGSGFSASEAISLDLFGSVRTTTATTNGNLKSTKVQVPSKSPFGPTALVATGASSGKSASAAVTVANAWAEFGRDASHTGFEPNDGTLFDLVHPGGNIFLDVAWNYQTGSSVDTSPAVARGVAYFGTTTGQLIAVDTANGSPVWTWTSPSGVAIAGSPAVDTSLGLVFVGSNDGNIDAISLTTGQLVWSMQLGGDVSAPVFGGGIVYATSTTGGVEALSESTGTVLWTASLAASVQAGPSLDVSGGALVVCDTGGVVQEFNPTTGAEGWTFQASGSIIASTAISHGSVYFGTSAGLLYALSETTGSELWSYQAAGAIGDTPTLTADITPGHVLELIVGDADGNLYFLQASNASVNYTMALGSAVTGVASVKGVALAETASGVITSARSYSDLDVWKYQTGAGLSTSPVINDGAVYVGAGDGKLYAFTSYGQPPD